MRPTSLVTESTPTISGNDAAECQSLSCPYLGRKIFESKDGAREEDGERRRDKVSVGFHFHMFHTALVCSSFKTETYLLF